MLCGFVGIILFFLVTDRFGNGGGFLVGKDVWKSSCLVESS